MTGSIGAWLTAVVAVPIVMAQSLVGLTTLTVPQDRLTAGCHLAQSDTFQVDAGHVKGGLWAGLPISTNPWHGTDNATIVPIRERVVGIPLGPDGPPLPRPELTRLRVEAARDVAEAYAAIYVDSDFQSTVVYGLRFMDVAPLASSRATAETIRIPSGDDRVLIVISGGSSCAGSVTDYLRNTIGRRP